MSSLTDILHKILHVASGEAEGALHDEIDALADNPPGAPVPAPADPEPAAPEAVEADVPPAAPEPEVPAESFQGTESAPEDPANA